MVLTSNLENVLYSKDVNKNLLNGIKYTKNDMKCDLKSRKSIKSILY